MSQRLAPHVVFYSTRRLETVLTAIENFISWEACVCHGMAQVRLIPISIRILSKR